MNIAFVTEMGFSGKIPRTHQNMRVEFAWMCALKADHYCYTDTPTKFYDIIITILPKKNIRVWSDLNVVEKFKSFSKKFAIMQEGPNWYFQDYDVPTQFWFYTVLANTDILFVHNKSDASYYSGLLNHPNVHVLPSLMIEDSVKDFNCDSREGVMIGGNFVSWYGGFDSYLVALEGDGSIHCPSMGRKQPEEDLIPKIEYLPYLNWVEWVNELSKRKVGVHLMRTHAAGTFALNCAYLGIPCIGYKGLDTQETCHPELTVDISDLISAKKAFRLLQDPTEYHRLSIKCKVLYEKNYAENLFLSYVNKILVE